MTDAELKTLRAKWKHSDYTEVLALIDALEEARREVFKLQFDNKLLHEEVDIAQGKHARAIAMEEAARLVESKGRWPNTNDIRALAPLPPTLVAVPRETLGQVNDAHRDLMRQMGSQSLDDDAAIEAARDRLSEALAALEKVGTP